MALVLRAGSVDCRVREPEAIMRRTLSLSPEASQQLRHLATHSSVPYLRERAAALLKIADGMSPHAVALRGLLQPRDPDTVYGWLERYLAEGIGGLRIRSGRGRRPAFSPSVAGRRHRAGGSARSA